MESFLLNTNADRRPRQLWIWSAWQQALLVVAGIVVPILCFVSARHGNWLVLEHWQSGTWQMYASLLLKWGPASPFYPLLLYSMVCLGLMTLDPQRFSTSFAVRLGIYTGALLAIQYLLLVFCPTSLRPAQLIAHLAILLFYGFLAVVIPVGAASLLVLLLMVFNWRSGTVWIALVGLACVLLVASVVGDAGGYGPPPVIDALLEGLGVVWSTAVIFGTPWAVAAYATLSFLLLRRVEGPSLQFSLIRLLAVIAWVSAFAGAWRISVRRMLVEYAQLPTSNPSCYIATAAATGHRRLVGSREIALPSGETLLANQQLRILKCGELILARTTPGVHRELRRIYDRWGPPLAQQMGRWPLLADLAYLSLKPCEWATRLTLSLLLPGWQPYARGLYAARPASPESHGSQAIAPEKALSESS